MHTTYSAIVRAAIWLASGTLALAQQPNIEERVQAVKASIASSQAALKQYEWIETTAVSVKGEEKSRRMERCYHGADGKLQKVPATVPAPDEKKRGLRGTIASSKKEELSDFAKDAVALVGQYVPPDAARIQAAKDAGKVSISPQPGQRVRLTIADYLKAGDSLALDIDIAGSRPLEAKVSTYLDSQKDPVSLQVRFATLDNGATYPAAVVLEAKAKSLKVDVSNSGYRRTPTELAHQGTSPQFKSTTA